MLKNGDLGSDLMYYKPFHHILLGEKGYLRYVGDLKTPPKKFTPQELVW